MFHLFMAKFLLPVYKFLPSVRAILFFMVNNKRCRVLQSLNASSEHIMSI